MFPARLSLRYRIALTIFLLQAVVMLLTLGKTLSFSYDSATQQLEENEQLILNLLTGMSRVALFTVEFDELQHHMEQVTADPHIVQIFLTNGDGNVVISTEFEYLGEPLPELISQGNLIWHSDKIDDLGVIAIQFSDERLTDSYQTMIQLGLSLALGGMSLITIAGLVFGHLLTHKLAILKEKTDQFSDGDLMVRIGFKGSDEISAVGQTFDLMAERISHNFQQLQHARDELELRVEERTSELQELNQKLTRLSKTDALTQIPNRGYFDTSFVMEWERYKRGRAPLAVILIDIDFFKPFNDNYGHQAGDDVLKRVAQALYHAVHRNSSDLVARYGGEEFVVVLPSTDIDGAKFVAEHLRESVANLKIPHEYSKAADHVTVSMGLASTQNCDVLDRDRLLNNADQALYHAKEAGRNQFILYQQM